MCHRGPTLGPHNSGDTINKDNWYTLPSQIRGGVPQAYNLPHAECRNSETVMG